MCEMLVVCINVVLVVKMAIKLTFIIKLRRHCTFESVFRRKPFQRVTGPFLLMWSLYFIVISDAFDSLSRLTFKLHVFQIHILKVKLMYMYFFNTTCVHNLLSQYKILHISCFK